MQLHFNFHCCWTEWPVIEDDGMVTQQSLEENRFSALPITLKKAVWKPCWVINGLVSSWDSKHWSGNSEKVWFLWWLVKMLHKYFRVLHKYIRASQGPFNLPPFSTGNKEWVKYQDAEYRFFDHHSTWVQAQRICSWFQAELVSIHNQVELDFLGQNLKKVGSCLEYIKSGREVTVKKQ